MGLPSKKRPKSEKRKRRAANKIKNFAYGRCPSCNKPIKSHHLCPFCGKYKGIEVVKFKLPKKEHKK